MPSLVIDLAPAANVNGNALPPRYVVRGLEQCAYIVDDGFPIAQLQATVVNGLADAIAQLYPGVYSIDINTRRKPVLDRIDRRTAELLAAGYTASGIAASLSADSQVRYLSMLQLSSLLSPLVVESIDGLTSVAFSVLNLLGAQVFAKNALTYAQGIVNAGAALKEQARAATTQAQLEVIADAR